MEIDDKVNDPTTPTPNNIKSPKDTISQYFKEAAQKSILDHDKLKKKNIVVANAYEKDGEYFFVLDYGQKLEYKKLVKGKYIDSDPIVFEPEDFKETWTVDLGSQSIQEYKYDLPKECIGEIFGNENFRDFELFRTEEGKFFLSTHLKGKPYLIELGGGDGNRPLRSYLLNAKRIELKLKDIKEYYDFLLMKAKESELIIKQEPRAFIEDDTIYYDLHNSKNQYVEINKKDFYIRNGILKGFRSNDTQKSQVLPIKGGSVNLLDKYFHLDPNSDQYQLLKISILCAFIPGFEHPLLIFEGEAYSGKTTASAFLKKIIDPTTSGPLSMPDEIETLIMNLNDHYFIPFDDVLEGINKKVSKVLCRAVTGDGIELRVKHQSEKKITREYMRCVLLNGTDFGPLKYDLISRSIIVNFSEVQPSEHNLVADLKKEFNNELPLILGAIFTTVSKALEIFPSVKVKDMTRLSAFEKYGYACAEALVEGGGKKFIIQYRNNVEALKVRAAEDNDLVAAITKLVENKPAWEHKDKNGIKDHGDMEELSTDFSKLAESTGLFYLQAISRIAPNALSRKLKGIKSLIASQGIILEELKRVTNYKPWRITNQNFQKSVDNSVPSSPPIGLVVKRTIKDKAKDTSE